MAIPFFFKYYILKRFFQYCNVSANNIRNIKSLALDFNSIIHDCLTFMEENHFNYRGKDIENELINLVIQKIESIIEKLKITDTIIIATDGLPTQGKMDDQRSNRRYNFTDRETLPNILGFSRTSITTGTSFMIKLDTKLKDYLSKQTIVNNIIYSNHEVIAEGECKLLNYYRRFAQEDNFKDQAHVIYGLDADLIVLCLMSPLKHIYIRRGDFETYVDINGLRGEIIRTLKHNDNDPRNIINDFVILTFLVGNDFIKRIPYFVDMGEDMPNITNFYINYKICLTNDSNINYQELKRFFRYMKIHEEDLRKLANSRKYGRYDYKNDMFNFRNDWYKNCLLLKGKIPIEDYNRITLDQVEETLSTKCKLVIDVDMKPIAKLFNPQKRIYEMCDKYVKTLYWIFEYYKNGLTNINFNFSYGFFFSPLMCDISDYLENNRNEISEYNSKDYVIPSIGTQMLYVIPPQLKNLAYSDLQFLYDNIYTSYLFPLKGGINTNGNIETKVLSIYNVRELDKVVRSIIGNSLDVKFEDYILTNRRRGNNNFRSNNNRDDRNTRTSVIPNKNGFEKKSKYNFGYRKN